MNLTRLESMNLGYLYLNGIKATDSMKHDENDGTIQRGFRAEFTNSEASVSFTVPETLLPEVIGCDALAVQIYKAFPVEDGAY